jgi:hypothetical protein
VIRKDGAAEAFITLRKRRANSRFIHLVGEMSSQMRRSNGRRRRRRRRRRRAYIYTAVPRPCRPLQMQGIILGEPEVGSLYAEISPTKSWGENSRKLSCLSQSPTSTECKIYTSFRL